MQYIIYLLSTIDLCYYRIPNHLGSVHSRKTARGQCFHDGLTKRSLENSLFSILLMEEILHQLSIVYPTIYMVLGIPDGAGFLPSPVLISYYYIFFAVKIVVVGLQYIMMPVDGCPWPC